MSKSKYRVLSPGKFPLYFEDLVDAKDYVKVMGGNKTISILTRGVYLPYYYEKGKKPKKQKKYSYGKKRKTKRTGVRTASKITIILTPTKKPVKRRRRA